MSDAQLSFRKSANIDRVTDKRKDSLFRLVDTDGSGTIDAQEFAVLYDAIKKDLAEELEKEAALAKEASSAKRRFKMLLLFVAVLVSFLAASVAANFAVIFTVVDQAITTTTTSTGILEVKGSDTIAKTATATQDVPLIVAPALDLDTLRQVKSLAVTYHERSPLFHHAILETVEASFTVVGVRKHNATFVEFILDGQSEVIQALNGEANLVRYPTASNGLTEPVIMEICAANASCSAFRASGIDVDAAMDVAAAALVDAGFSDGSRRLSVTYVCTSGAGWTHIDFCGHSWYTMDDIGDGTCSVGGNALPSISNIGLFYKDNGAYGKHAVYFLHGKNMNSDDMWEAFCINGAWDAGAGAIVPLGDCPQLKIPAFENLIFVLISSSLTDDGTLYTGAVGWSRKVETSDYAESESALAIITCGSDSGPLGTGSYSSSFMGCNRGSGILGGLGVSSWHGRIMLMGFSDGGGFAVYLHWFHSFLFSAAHAIDYWAFGAYNEWVPSYKYGWVYWSRLNMNIVTTCASMMHIDQPGLAIFPETKTTPPNTLPFAAGLGWDPIVATGSSSAAKDVTWSWGGPNQDPWGASTTSQGTLSGVQFIFTTPSCGKQINYTVEGMTATALPNGADAGASVWTAGCATGLDASSPSAIHDEMLAKTDIVGAITTFKTHPYSLPYGSYSACQSEWFANFDTRRRLDGETADSRRLAEAAPVTVKRQLIGADDEEPEVQMSGRALSGFYSGPPSARCLKKYTSDSKPCTICSDLTGDSSACDVSRRKLMYDPSGYIADHKTKSADTHGAKIVTRATKMLPKYRRQKKISHDKKTEQEYKLTFKTKGIRFNRPIVFRSRR